MTHARWTSLWLIVTGVGLAATAWAYDEPYPFRKKPYDPPKEIIIKTGFEHGLPEEAETKQKGKAEVKAEVGKGGTQALAISGTNVADAVRIPFGHGLGMARFEVDFDFRGEGFPQLQCSLVAYDREDKVLGRYGVYNSWAHDHWAHAHNIVSIEVESLFKVALVFGIGKNDRGGSSSAGPDGRSSGQKRIGPEYYVDNLLVRRHQVPKVPGHLIRDRLQEDLRREGGGSSVIADHIVTQFKDEGRTSYFYVGDIKVDRRYLQSVWRKRLHAGSTYKKQHGTLDQFVLGVVLDRNAVVDAAKRQKKSVGAMYDYIIDDVHKHNFNTIWMRNFKTDRETFCAKADAKGLKTILTDNTWLGVGAWRSKYTDPRMPASVKKAIDRELPKIARLKGLLAYQVYGLDSWHNDTIGPKLAALWAKVRAYMKQVAPKVKLLQPYHHWTLAEHIQDPPPDLAFQDLTTYYAYSGRPYGFRRPTWLLYYYGEDWWRRHVDYGLRRNGVPYVWLVPVGREFHCRNIRWKRKLVDERRSGYEFDEKTQAYSGWRRYRWPRQFIKALLWSAACSGAKGVVLDEYGPSRVHPDVTTEDFLGRAGKRSQTRGPQIHDPRRGASEKEKETGVPKPKRDYPPAVYKVDTLRQYDMSELGLWAEATRQAARVRRVGRLMLDLTPHGARDIRINNSSYILARLMTRRKGGGKFVLLVNRILEDPGKLQSATQRYQAKINFKTGMITETDDQANFDVSLRVDTKLSLYNVLTGTELSGEKTPGVDKSRTYSITMTPGQVAIYVVGQYSQYSRIAKQYGLRRRVKKKRRSKWID